jgi:hypothetical protein
MMADMTELLTVGQAATLAGVSVRTMRRRVATGAVMTSGHGQARRIVAASVLAASPPSTPAITEDNAARGGHAAVTPAMTVGQAVMTEDRAASDTPAMTALVTVVDRLTAENRDLGRQLVDATAAATLWQARADVLAVQLEVARDEIKALMAPEGSVARNLTPEPPDPTPGPPGPFPWPLPATPNGAPWWRSDRGLAVLVALVLLGGTLAVGLLTWR